MRAYRFAMIALATVVLSAFATRPASAATWQLCIHLNGAAGSDTFYLNFNVQGSAIMVGGSRGVFSDDQGPVFGTLTQVPLQPGVFQMGLTTTIANRGDYMGINTENVVVFFGPGTSMTYKRWLNSSQTFTTGTVSMASCVS